MNEANSYQLGYLNRHGNLHVESNGYYDHKPSPFPVKRKEVSTKANGDVQSGLAHNSLIDFTNQKFGTLSTLGLFDDESDQSTAVSADLNLIHSVVARFDNKTLLYELQRINNPGSINETDCSGFTPLHIAARLDNADAISTLAQYGASIDCKSIDGDSPIHTALRHQSHAALKALLNNDATATIPNKLGATPLHIACAKKDYYAVSLLLSKTTQCINYADKFDMLPIHYAALGGDIKICELLLQSGAFAFEKANNGETPLILAAGENNTEVMKLLLIHASQKDKNRNGLTEYVNVKMNDGTTALHWAALVGNVEALSVLIENGAFVNDLSFMQLTPLHLGASSPNTNVVRLLVSNGSQLEAMDEQGRTPLHLAALSGTEESIKFLIGAGANIDSKTRRGYTPLFLAVMKSRVAIVKTFVEYGASLVLEDADQLTCLHHAVRNGDISVVSQLIASSGFLTNVARDAIGRTAMHHAACLDRPKILSLLIDKSSMRGTVDFYGKTPLHIAAERGSLRCIKILLEDASSEVKSAKDASGNTPLHSATCHGHDDACRLLIDAGISVNSHNNDGQTPLHIATNSHLCTKALEELLLNHADTEMKDNKGDTALITAVKQNNIRAVQLLLDSGASLTTLNSMGKNPLHAAIDKGQEDACITILRHQRWNESLGDNSSSQQMLLSKLVEAMPRACELVLDKCIEFSNHHADHPDLRFTFNFLYMEPTPEVSKAKKVRDLLPTKMVKFQREELLLHPVTTQYLDFKWRAIGRYFYYISFLFYLVYLVTMTYLIVTERERNIEEFVYMQRMGAMGGPNGMMPNATSQPMNGTSGLQNSMMSPTPKARKRRMAPPDKNQMTTKQGMITTTAKNVIMTTLPPNITNTGNKSSGTSGSTGGSNGTKNSGSTTNNQGTTNTNLNPKPRPKPSEGSTGKALGTLTLVFSVIMLAKEFVQMYLTGIKYFRELTNYVEVLLYGFSIVYMIEFIFRIGWRDENTKYQLGILSLFLIYLNLLLYLQRVTMFKLYVVMFMQVVRTLLRVFLVFSVAVLGFAFTFYQMFPKQKTYNTIARSIVKVLVMLTGEIDYEDSVTSNIGEIDSESKYPLVPFADLSYLVVVVFLLILAVGLMNLLVGLAVGDIQAIRRHARMQVEIQNVEFAQDIYNSLPKMLCNRFYRTSLDTFPNRATIFRKIQGKFNDNDDAKEVQLLMKSIRNRTEQLSHENKTRDVKNKKKQRLDKMESNIENQQIILQKIAEKLQCVT